MFNKKIMILALMLLFLCTISSVSAVENVDDFYDGDDITSISDDDIQLKLDDGTFSDLADEIADADFELNLTRDYTYCNHDEYYIKGIPITKNITINGNGFTINGNNQAMAFQIVLANVSLNNINFVNCYNDGKGGAVYIFASDVDMDDVAFINNRAVFGGAISVMGNLSINNSVFRDSSCNYATAIFSENSNLIINNTQFENLKAEMSAGAVGVKSFENLIIENCNFINTSSARNGGAVLFDSGEKNQKSFIRNVSFRNTFGDFGGAFIQYGGILDMQDSIFINSTSEYDGGAVYLANVSATIDNSQFISNKVTLYDDYQTFGGAIYCDLGFLRLTNSIFADNSANEGSAVISIYDSTYEIINSTFDNDGEAVYAIFKGENSEIVNCSGEDTVSDENGFYPYVVSGAGRNITFVDDGIDFDTLPSRFDLRDYNLTSPVVDQGIRGSCWAFGAIGTLESALLKFAGLNISLSINNLQNTMSKYSRYGISYMDESGYNELAMAYFLSWLGAIPQEYETYDELGKISSLSITSNNIHVQDFIVIPRDAETPGDPNMKQAILEYGGLYADINGIASDGNVTGYYNEKTACQYINEPLQTDHLVTIVGWDDDISRDNFIITPPGDGAWIVKNSWGTSFGDEGYYYVSYYDETLCTSKDNEITKCAIAVILNNTINYNRNYQYDFAGFSNFDNFSSDSVTYATKFVSVDDDYIAAVGTYFNQSGIDYTIKLEVNGEIVYNQTGVSLYYGYQTIKLNECIPIKKGDNFTAYVTSNRFPLSSYGRIVCQDGVSLICVNGQWYDTYDEWNLIACLKVYTVDEPPKKDTHLVAAYDNANRLLIVNLTNEQTGESLEGANVVVNIGGEEYVLKTNSAGQASLSLADLASGSYVATVSYKGNASYAPASTNMTVFVKFDSRISAVYDDIAKELTVSLVNDVTGAPLSGASVVVNVDGKSYTVKINSKGKGVVSLANLALGTYDVDVSFNGGAKSNPSNVSLQIVTKYNSRISAVYNEATKALTVTLVNDATGAPLSGANVVVNVGGKNYTAKINGGGKAVVYLTDLTSGTHVATVSYNGGAKCNPSSANVTVFVKFDSRISAVYDDIAKKLTVSLVNDATGAPLSGASVVVNVGGANYTVKINSKGNGVVSLDNLAPGTYVATVSFNGGAKSNPSNASLQIVTKYNSRISAVYNEATKALTVTLVNDATGAPLSGANVVVNVGGKNYTAKINGGGKAVVYLTGLTSGTHVATVSYKGGTKCNPANTTVNVIVKFDSRISAVYDDITKKLTVTLVNGANGAPLSGASVVVNVGGANYTVKINSKGNGVVSLDNLAPGTYDVTVSYSGGAKCNPSNASLQIVTKYNSRISAVYNEATKALTVTLVNDATGAPLTGASVIVNVGGASSTVKVNGAGKGVVSLADLKPGSYNATISYKGGTKCNPSSTNVNVVVND